MYVHLKNDTSAKIAGVIGNYNFDWNDLFPFAPIANTGVDQRLLRQLLDTGKIDELVRRMQLRMHAFIEDESVKGHHSVVVVAGGTANAAFKKFSGLVPISTFLSQECVFKGMRASQLC